MNFHDHMAMTSDYRFTEIKLRIQNLLSARHEEDQQITQEQFAVLPASLLALKQAKFIAPSRNSIDELQKHLATGISHDCSLPELEAFLAGFKANAQKLNLPITDRSYLPFIYQLAPNNHGLVTFFCGKLESFNKRSFIQTTSSLPILSVQGGVGTEAGVDFIKNIISIYPKVATENEFNPEMRPFGLMLLSNSATPDRSTKIDHLQDDFVPDPERALFGGLKILFSLGADVSCVACNTAHYWLSDAVVQQHLGVESKKQMSIISALIDNLTQKKSITKDVIVLATRGTTHTGLYQQALRDNGIRVKDLSPEEVDVVHDAIYKDIKAGFPKRALAPLMAIAERYPQHLLILCCTELGLVLNEVETPELFQAERLLDNNKVSPEALILKILNESTNRTLFSPERMLR